MLGGWDNTVQYWELGNEVDLAGNWNDTAHNYGNFVTLANATIKADCPNCTVIISFSSPYAAAPWPSLPGTICNSFDMFDLHFIDGFHADPFIQSGDLTKWKQACPGKSIISTETGIPDTNDSLSGIPHSGGSLTSQATDLIKYNTYMFTEGYDKIYWYLIDTDYGVSPQIFLHDALINQTGSQKPAYTSYKVMIDKVNYFTNVSKVAQDEYEYQFTNKNPVYVLWCEKLNLSDCTIPAELHAVIVNVTDYLGNSQIMNTTSLNLTNTSLYVQPV